MNTELATDRVWTAISRARKKSKGPAFVAVAYFGQDAAELLPLREGSTLVVDASLGQVKAGATHPADLLKLLNRGVRIFSVPGLHAKVFVFGSTALVGSANVSKNSRDDLCEALLLTTDRDAVAASKKFIQSLAKRQLGPEQLDRLQKDYRPPRMVVVPAGRRKRGSGRRGAQPQLKLLQLNMNFTWTEEDTEQAEIGAKVAAKRRKHPRSWKMDYFKWTGRMTLKLGDEFLFVLKNGNKRLLYPPATVLGVQSYKGSRGGNAAIVSYEMPAAKGRDVAKVAKKLGPGALKRLKDGGLLSRKWSDRLKEIWH
jgi:hypothetical protein